MTQDEIKTALKKLEDDPAMITESTYSPLATEWPGNRLPFVEFHLTYLSRHKLTDPQHYLSNLRLMITKR